MNDNNEQDRINECLSTMLTNDDYMWVNFTKPCGYSVMHPFLRNDSVQALYRYLDHCWTNSNNVIWFLHPDNPIHRIVIDRSLTETLYSFFHRHNILRRHPRTSYTLYFDTQSYAAYFQGAGAGPRERPVQVPIVCPCHPAPARAAAPAAAEATPVATTHDKNLL